LHCTPPHTTTCNAFFPGNHHLSLLAKAQAIWQPYLTADKPAGPDWLVHEFVASRWSVNVVAHSVRGSTSLSLDPLALPPQLTTCSPHPTTTTSHRFKSTRVTPPTLGTACPALSQCRCTGNCNDFPPNSSTPGLHWQPIVKGLRRACPCQATPRQIGLCHDKCRCGTGFVFQVHRRRVAGRGLRRASRQHCQTLKSCLTTACSRPTISPNS